LGAAFWLLGALFVLTNRANAQTTTTDCGGSGLPACPSTTTTRALSGFDRVQDLGNKREGETFQITNNCDFAGQVVKTINGTNDGTGTGPCPITTITIVDDGIGNPTALGRTPGLFGVIGLHLAQATRTPQIRVDGVLYNANALNVRNALVVQGTATGGLSGRWTNYFTIVPPAGPAAGGNALGRTGAMILRWSLLGGALLAVGALLVMAARRRRLA
jgi:hypothetical protein